ncbi:MAG: hypothetical protein D6784_00130 [Chloroflexi bacterium]|nr:MAG: hypothetical protein D6784_00130 [Chloroflexota bacterium]
MNKKKLKLLVILGDGGHTTEMLVLVDLLGPKYDYAYLVSHDDLISEGKIRIPGPVYRTFVPTHKHKRRWYHFLNLWNILRFGLSELGVLLKVRPQAILSVGAGIAVPISIWGRLLGVRVIHVETGSRVYSMSTTGKWMYRIAHLFFVQWEPLQKKYPKAIYAGRLL